MTAEQFEFALKAFLSRQPFHPFTISLTSGSRVEIDEPSAIAHRNGLVAHMSADGITSFFDHESVVALSSGPECDAPSIVERAKETT